MTAEVQSKSVADQILQPSAQPPFSFAFNDFLKREYRFGLDPNRPICKAYQQGHCPLGSNCPDKHHVTSSYNNLVCKHWLRGLCKKGDACEFLHEYNLRRMPECSYYSRKQICSNGDDCLYLHIDPEAKRPACPHYERGFCPLGPRCANKHIKKDKICVFYLAGFCPNGKTCKEGGHPRFPQDSELEKPQVRIEKTKEQLAAEKEQRELEAERERERERELDDLNPGQGGGQKFRGGWQNRKKRGGGRHRGRGNY